MTDLKLEEFLKPVGTDMFSKVFDYDISILNCYLISEDKKINGSFFSIRNNASTIEFLINQNILANYDLKRGTVYENHDLKNDYKKVYDLIKHVIDFTKGAINSLPDKFTL